MIRDPTVKRADGNPECFGNFSAEHYMCNNKCYKFLSCKSETEEDDKRREGKQFKNNNGVPLCFGELYSPLSPECQDYCNDAHDCETTSEDNEKRRRISTSSGAIRSERLSILRDGPQRQPQPQQVFTQQPTQFNFSVDERTQQYVKQKYGVGLKIDPTVPGQFEGEEWYERFFKEVLKYSGYYALQLLGLVIMNSRWAPKKPGQEEQE